MNKNSLNIELVYFYIILDKFCEKPTKKNLSKILNLFDGYSFYNLEFIYTIKSVLISTYNLDNYIHILFNYSDNLNLILQYSKKLLDVIDKYFISIMEEIKSKSFVVQRLNTFISLAKNYKNFELINYFYEISNFLLYKIKKVNSQSIPLNLYTIYYILNDYIYLFDDLQDIILNHSQVKNYFIDYFKYIQENPQIVIFINNKHNIRIMQNLFPIETFEYLIKEAGLKKELSIMNKYFLIEIDKGMLDEISIKILAHEVGHLLNLNIFNFQSIIFDNLYSKDSSVNINILNSWLNEIIADLLGRNISDECLYIKSFDKLDKKQWDRSYPPLDFRISLMNNTKYDTTKIKDLELAKIAELIQDNIADINTLLKIVKVN